MYNKFNNSQENELNKNLVQSSRDAVLHINDKTRGNDDDCFLWRILQWNEIMIMLVTVFVELPYDKVTLSQPHYGLQPAMFAGNDSLF